MTKRELFLNQDLRAGGFYELSIQVCPSQYTKPTADYLTFVWSLPNVEGPFNQDFTRGSIEVENYEHQGLLILEGVMLPFSTYTISEEEGYNWFDICIPTAAIETLLGEEFIVWAINPKCPKVIDDFFIQTLTRLNTLYPFLLGIIDFEVSGQYYLENFITEMIKPTSSRFYIGKRYFDEVQPENKTKIQKIE